MKNAKTYEKGIKKLLAKCGKPGSKTLPPVATLIHAVFEYDASEKDATRAMAALEEEFVDYNELRIAPAKDIVECIGRDYPYIRQRAEMITQALRGVFEREYKISLEYMEKMAKRDLRRHLQELGLNEYVSAIMLLKTFDGHAIPVDTTLVEVLEMRELIEPGSTIGDVQGFLERIIPQKDALVSHEFFRSYISGASKELEKLHEKKRLAAEKEAAEKAAAEEKARLEKEAAEEAARKAAEEQAAKKAAKEAEKAARAAERAKKAAEKAKAATRKATKKKTAKKATAKKVAKKTAPKKAVKKKAKKKTAKKK